MTNVNIYMKRKISKKLRLAYYKCINTSVQEYYA